MSTVSDGGQKHEIIIVRHARGDHDEGHHGGVWKIAFADFMTAMMCFFLVMWLINAANEQTKSAVASYFNPVKLIDRNSSTRGLEDIGNGPNPLGASEDKGMDAAGPADSTGPNTDGRTQKDTALSTDSSDTRADDKLFADPYAVLAEIAANTDMRQNISTKGEGGTDAAGPASGADGGQSYRDPFAPDFWSQQVEMVENTDDKAPEIDTRNTKAERRKSSGSDEVGQSDQAGRKPDGQPSAADIAQAKQIEKELADALGKGAIGDGISVVATERGISISVTEELDFGMFEIGSAVPRPELVRAMEKIGKVLSGHKGAIVVDGHTDARPFRDDKYDNWRLSTARAHSAYYMIARSGLDENRIVQVAGFADRKLKNPSDPMAAQNRRIEILLETGG
ncbi:flagellar motor protein MotB [Arvimicrobium flavum]|uniref:flagellar motor protein MotB n=1 Tax=Arvimicrobium flavum TaxID=3393320 RepID=UPI00237A2220|nr:flagellar motor protein MotB [Mesorhizobium shangrilense]